jgi:hypothetical protein
MNKRYALTVGNNYPGTGAQLAGCVNDALDWAELLRTQGYEVTVLTEATKAQTLGSLDFLVAKAGFGDRVVFQFSGHGTWVPDRDGDEADSRDEALVCADYGYGTAGLILDDELQKTFARLRYGAGALTLSDSCHSGTVARFYRHSGATPRFLSPAEILPDLTEQQARDMEAIPASDPRKTSSLISGCADAEYSYDAQFDGRPNGAFSRIAIDAFSPGISLNSWHDAIRAELPDEIYPQTPQLVAASLYRKYAKAL